ncbi:23S rRNA pseudouridine(1911/1915/1917) synthase RluD [Legionella israelensis]|uniref:23S rRNA pseudouridine(1911/1915/1917) synthase RluD n=1 Tax=Legionella israelensis TaxID=454 RepID=UPI001180948F|nr:23S rRNA pseudouridine(1911/1915/1917) synthase RluD [Legionella israelensis]QDP72792.1 23S rRNA pseudouridine(1911/1915/1917) synthase RluD [Legionella israelensis]
MSEKSIKKEHIIPSEFHGQRLDSVLASLFPEYSRSILSKWIKEDFIKLNDKPCRPKDKVSSGDKILMDVSIEREDSGSVLQAQSIPLNIIYEDNDILILNKPANLVVHPGAGNLQNTLVNGLLYYSSQLQKLPRAGIIHRLDKDTTGLLIVAKSLVAYTDLIRQMHARDIQRQYLALVHGYVVSGGVIKTAFGRHPVNRLKMAVTPSGKEAITQYSIRQHLNDYTLLDVKLMTGRTHQIRVHMAHIHHPILGDPLYGSRTKFPSNADEALRKKIESFKRQALHAYYLKLMHPLSKRELTFTAPLPDDFAKLLQTLEDHYGHHQS